MQTHQMKARRSGLDRPWSSELEGDAPIDATRMPTAAGGRRLVRLLGCVVRGELSRLRVRDMGVMRIRHHRLICFVGLEQVTHGLKLLVAQTRQVRCHLEMHFSAWRRNQARLSVEVMPAI